MALAFALVPAAHGAALYSNVGTSGGDSSGTGQIDTTAQRIGQPFVATASGTARLVGFYGVSYLNAPATVSVSLYSDNGNQPGTLLATGAQAVIDDTSDGSPTCTTLSAAPALTAGTKYWAVFQTYSNTAFWSTASLNAGQPSPKTSANSGTTWAASAMAARSLLVDDGASCQPDIVTIPSPNPDPNAELGDMYAKPGGTSFQTLSARNIGVADLRLDVHTATFTGQSPGTPAGMFKLRNGDPDPNAHPPGSAFTTAKTLGSGGLLIMYISCLPPLGTPDGMYTATFTLTSNDPDESPLTWPVWCLLDSTPPSIEFTINPDGRNGWFVTDPAHIQVRGVDPGSGDRVIREFCSDNGEATFDWKNGPIAPFDIGPEGIHNLDCQATDLAKNTSAPGAYKATVKVAPTPPDTAKGDGPPAASEATAATFGFTGSDATSGVQEFECSLDGGDYELCTSPATRSKLPNGTHTFDVRARDAAGTYDPTPVRWTWDVIAPAPQAADDTAAASRNASLDIDVLANDVGPPGAPLAIVLGGDTTEKGGSVSVTGSKVHYVPPSGFAGTDSFSYQAVSETGVMSAPATVTVVVAPKGAPGAGDKCTVPKIKRGTSLRAVKKALKEAGCTAGKIKRKHSSKVDRGKLIKLKPKAGTVLDAGAPVRIVVSSGP
jgi:hypothetical protein